MQQKIFYDADAYEKSSPVKEDPPAQTEQVKEDEEASEEGNDELAQQYDADLTGITGYRRREEQSNPFFQKREDLNNADKTEIS